MEIEYRFASLPELRAKYLNAPTVIREEQIRSMNRAALIVEHDAKALAPWYTGTLRRSITHEVTATAGAVFGIIGTNVTYAAAVEDGRRAGAPMPPKGALIDWMRSKGIDESLEFVVRRAIGARGIKAKPYLRPAYEQNKAEIYRELSSLTTARILQRMKAGGITR